MKSVSVRANSRSAVCSESNSVRCGTPFALFDFFIINLSFAQRFLVFSRLNLERGQNCRSGFGNAVVNRSGKSW